MNWRDQAACAGADTDLFFPEDREGSGNGDTSTERDIIRVYCTPCEVRQSCLDDAMATETTLAARNGVRGGLTSRERNRLAKEGAA